MYIINQGILQSIKRIELIKNLETDHPQFFYVDHQQSLEKQLQFKTLSQQEFEEFTNHNIYERLWVFECDKSDVSDFDNFLFHCSYLERLPVNRAGFVQHFTGFNNKTPLEENDFSEEVKLYVNDHFFESEYQLEINIPTFIKGFKVYQTEFRYAFEGATSYNIYFWDRYI